MEKFSKFIPSVVTIAIGLLLLIMRAGIVKILLTVLGVMFIVMGIMDAVQKKDVPGCVIKCVIGAVIIVLGWLVVEVMLYILGALLVIVGVLGIVKLVQRHTKGDTLLATISAYLVPSLYVVIGILLFFNQAGFVDVIFIITGVIVLVNGIIQLVNTIKEHEPTSSKKKIDEEK